MYEIDGGNITASSKSDGAGIGGGCHSNGGTVTINGGTINASGNYGAGIGDGQFGRGTSVHINDGTVNASFSAGAGVGSPDEMGGGTGSVYVYGGVIAAHSDKSVAVGYANNKCRVYLH